jgi:hypothetical protein
MADRTALSQSYANLLASIKDRIQKAQVRAVRRRQSRARSPVLEHRARDPRDFGDKNYRPAAFGLPRKEKSE